MSGADEFANWFITGAALTLLIPIALAIGLYVVLRRTFLLKPIWSVVVAAGTLALICAILFAA